MLRRTYHSAALLFLLLVGCSEGPEPSPSDRPSGGGTTGTEPTQTGGSTGGQDAGPAESAPRRCPVPAGLYNLWTTSYSTPFGDFYAWCANMSDETSTEFWQERTESSVSETYSGDCTDHAHEYLDDGCFVSVERTCEDGSAVDLRCQVSSDGSRLDCSRNITETYCESRLQSPPNCQGDVVREECVIEVVYERSDCREPLVLDGNACHAPCPVDTHWGGAECLPGAGPAIGQDGGANDASRAVCGNGVVEAAEACDDGNDNDLDDCRDDCTRPVCGDRVHSRDAIGVYAEACDDGSARGEGACLADCSGVQTCGDGEAEGDEACDDGNDNDLDDCRSDCTLPVCGDGVVSGQATAGRREACDDGDAVDNGEGGCLADCSAIQSCGNGLREGTEGCDGESRYCLSDCRVQPMLSGGYIHTCAVGESGGLRCWGANHEGQLGHGASAEFETALVGVSGLDQGVVAVAAGWYHTCALLETGGVQCWGHNGNGQIGDRTVNIHPNTPQDVYDLSGVVALAAGGHHTCAVLATGAVRCWGAGLYGQTGNGDDSTWEPDNVAVLGLSDQAVAVTAGFAHTCALLESGGVQCWGYDASGQLGDAGDMSDQLTAVAVDGLASGVVQVVAGAYHTCALLDTGAVKCWGDDLYGQLGDGNDSVDMGSPVDVTGLDSGVVALAAGEFHSCALLDSGAVKCWGRSNYGQLGNGSRGTWYEPVDVVGLSAGAVDLIAGSYHTCVLLDSGGAQCWGNNEYGELGNGQTANYEAEPVDVVGLP